MSTTQTDYPYQILKGGSQTLSMNPKPTRHADARSHSLLPRRAAVAAAPTVRSLASCCKT